MSYKFDEAIAFEPLKSLICKLEAARTVKVGKIKDDWLEHSFFFIAKMVVFVRRFVDEVNCFCLCDCCT